MGAEWRVTLASKTKGNRKARATHAQFLSTDFQKEIVEKDQKSRELLAHRLGVSKLWPMSPNLSHHMFLYSLQAENRLYIFLMIEENQKRDNIF